MIVCYKQLTITIRRPQGCRLHHPWMGSRSLPCHRRERSDWPVCPYRPPGPASWFSRSMCTGHSRLHGGNENVRNAKQVTQLSLLLPLMNSMQSSSTKLSNLSNPFKKPSTSRPPWNRTRTFISTYLVRSITASLSDAWIELNKIWDVCSFLVFHLKFEFTIFPSRNNRVRWNMQEEYNEMYMSSLLF